MEETNPRLRKIILQIVSNQLRNNDPTETKETLNRLIAADYSMNDAKELIGAVVSAHIFDMLKEKHVFDNSKFIKDLKKLPTLPWES